ncbi:MAG: hypothetical protein K2N94_06005, partial [Lachnospiraceae bacterium]|nr:hypothetical protein [Lachnospiraceae bacterium]
RYRIEFASGGPLSRTTGSVSGSAERIEIVSGGTQDRTAESGSGAAERISSVSENSQGTTPGKVSASSVQPARPVTAEAAAASGGCRNVWRTENREERVFRCLTPMYPFDDSEFERGVRMEPQDIGMLPKALWKLAGNSFLLHSFYTYQHLLFTRKRQKEGNVCFLMLPGIYNEREQHMAQMFGFTRFRPVKRQPLENGAFGYWYMEVRFENF